MVIRPIQEKEGDRAEIGVSLGKAGGLATKRT